MKKINIIIMILLVSMLAGCGHENISMDFSGESDEEMTALSTEKKGAVAEEETIYVYISGQVKNPGVYQFDSGARVFEVLEKAGGFTKKAKVDYLNQAEPVSDGQSIYVMSKKEYKESISPPQDEVGESEKSISNNKGSSEKVNLNSATEQELTALPGIGTSKAKAIIEYRETNGRFTKIEDLKKVSGIGDTTYSNLESMIAID